jgi:hypothetical protein
MTANCKKCGWEIVDLNFSEEQRLEICGLIEQDLKLFAVNKLISDFGIGHARAKGIVLHLNKFGKCHNCNFVDLKGEYAECPKCKSFNYNLKIETSFNHDFCSHLEHKLDFNQLDNSKVKGFWCDGVDHFTSDLKSLAKSHIQNNKMIKTKAWIGLDGQEEYEMTIRFGEKSIANYKNDLSLIDCIPDNSCGDWIKIEPDRKEIEIKLK